MRLERNLNYAIKMFTREETASFEFLNDIGVQISTLCVGDTVSIDSASVNLDFRVDKIDHETLTVFMTFVKAIVR